MVTIFPEFFGDPLKTGLLGKAIESGQAAVGLVDPRAFTTDRHHKVDDVPYGGGAGMVMKPEPMRAAIRAARAHGGGPVLLLTPQGRPIAQDDLARWAKLEHLVLVAGRYEGFDERIRAEADEEVSLGDFVLTGGEYAALAVIDGVIRLRPFTLGNKDSAEEDSFSKGILEYPHYTRPPEFEGSAVPDVLLSGHHAEIAAWRRARALERTRWRRPDLLEGRGFSKVERAVLHAAPSNAPAIELVIWVRRPELARIDEIARLARAYGVRAASLVAADATVEAALPRVVEARAGAGVFRIVSEENEVAALFDPQGAAVIVALAGPAPSPVTIGPRALAQRAVEAGAAIRLVLGHWPEDDRFDGLGPRAEVLPSVRVASAENDLPLLAALAVLLDRLIGEG